MVGVSVSFGSAFAFVLVLSFAFAFAFAFVLAFSFAVFSHVKSIAAARSVFSGHVTELLEQEFSKRAECAGAESVRSCPRCQV